MHEGDGNVREDGGTAGGDFVAGENTEEAGKKNGDVADGAKILEIADERGGGVFFWQVAGTGKGFEAWRPRSDSGGRRRRCGRSVGEN